MNGDDVLAVGAPCWGIRTSFLRTVRQGHHVASLIQRRPYDEHSGGGLSVTVLGIAGTISFGR